jgi:hypothetical protein
MEPVTVSYIHVMDRISSTQSRDFSNITISRTAPLYTQLIRNRSTTKKLSEMSGKTETVRYVMVMIFAVCVFTYLVMMLVTSWGTAGTCAYGATGNLCNRLPQCDSTETYSESWKCVPSNCFGRCLNDGICDESIGICNCPDNVYGGYCQHTNCPLGAQITCGDNGECATTENGLLYCVCSTSDNQLIGPFCDILPTGDPVCAQCTIYEDDEHTKSTGTYSCAIGDVFQITNAQEQICIVCPGTRCVTVIDTPVSSTCSRPGAPDKCDVWH